MLYYSLIFPLINYYSIVCAATYPSCLPTSLLVIQKRFFRMISHSNRQGPFAPLFRNDSLLSMRETFFRHACNSFVLKHKQEKYVQIDFIVYHQTFTCIQVEEKMISIYLIVIHQHIWHWNHYPSYQLSQHSKKKNLILFWPSWEHNSVGCTCLLIRFVSFVSLSFLLLLVCLCCFVFINIVCAMHSLFICLFCSILMNKNVIF